MVREGEYRLRSGSLRDDDLRGMEKQCSAIGEQTLQAQLSQTNNNNGVIVSANQAMHKFSRRCSPPTRIIR